MSHAAQLHHAVNGFFDAFRSKPSSPQVAAQPASRASRVRVPSRYNEDDDESLLESATSLPRQTLSALQKAIRADGFKGADVSGWSQGQRGGFTVHYKGEPYEFEISESATPRPMGEIGRAVKASGRYESNGRGIYHETPAGKNDMVIHQDHRGRWRIDLVTSTGGNHTDVTGSARDAGGRPNQGYGSAEEAFQAALDVQRTRGIRGKSHVYIADSDGNLSDYEPEGAHLPFERNGRQSGILSDGTRVNVYHQPGTIDEYTVVPHGMDWDQMEHGGMRSMLGLSATGAGFSQWTDGQEGRHLGRKVHWDQVSPELKRHIEQRVVGEASMSANGRASTVDEQAARDLSIYIENEYALIGAPNSTGKSIDANLRKKVASGKYDPAQAPRAWQYLIDEGAKRYTKEFGSGGGIIFSAATRRQVAEDFARAWEEEYSNDRRAELSRPSHHTQSRGPVR